MGLAKKNRQLILAVLGVRASFRSASLSPGRPRRGIPEPEKRHGAKHADDVTTASDNAAMKTPLAALLLAALPVLAADPPKPIPVNVTLEPGKVYEECIKLAKGQSRRFEWTSTAPVDFNVHYHKGDAAYYPFKANNRKAAKARFTAEHSDDFCWMWTALKAPAQVSGTIK